MALRRYYTVASQALRTFTSLKILASKKNDCLVEHIRSQEYLRLTGEGISCTPLKKNDMTFDFTVSSYFLSSNNIVQTLSVQDAFVCVADGKDIAIKELSRNPEPMTEIPDNGPEYFLCHPLTRQRFCLESMKYRSNFLANENNRLCLKSLNSFLEDDMEIQFHYWPIHSFNAKEIYLS